MHHVYMLMLSPFLFPLIKLGLVPFSLTNAPNDRWLSPIIAIKKANQFKLCSLLRNWNGMTENAIIQSQLKCLCVQRIASNYELSQSTIIIFFNFSFGIIVSSPHTKKHSKKSISLLIKFDVQRAIRCSKVLLKFPRKLTIANFLCIWI